MKVHTLSCFLLSTLALALAARPDAGSLDAATIGEAIYRASGWEATHRRGLFIFNLTTRGKGGGRAAAAS